MARWCKDGPRLVSAAMTAMRHWKQTTIIWISTIDALADSAPRW
jgi:hypothetical protein